MRLKQDVSTLTLIPGSGGVFEVKVGNETIHSKKATGNFPDPEQILKQVRGMR